MKNDDPIRLAGAQLDHARHACAFFNSEDDEYRVLLPFIREGFVWGHKAVHVVSPHRCARHIGELIAAGIDAEDAQWRGQLDIRFNTETYLHEGRFDQNRMLQTFEQIANSRKEIFSATRFVCQMEWAADHPSCIHDVIEFEARVNHLWSRHNDTVVCVYNIAKFSSDTILDVMRTHPLMIVGDIIQRNPFFVPPNIFLRELRERAPSSQARES